MRPGLTGLAQLVGHYDLHPANKLRYDLIYTKRMNAWLDLKLISKSVGTTLTMRWDRRRVDTASRAPTAESETATLDNAKHTSRA